MIKRKFMRLFLFALVSASTACAMRFLYAHITTVNTYKLTPNALFAQDRAYELISFLSQSKQKSLQKIQQDILNQFPEVRKLEVYRSHPYHARVVTSLARPQCRVNDLLVFTENAQLLPAQHFCSDYVEQLPLVKTVNTVNNDTSAQETQELKSFLQQTTPEFLDRYAITWHNKTHIQLDENKAGHTFLIRYDHIPNEHLIAQCARVRNLLMIDGTRHEVPQIADLRFDHQIIMRKGAWGDG